MTKPSPVSKEQFEEIQTRLAAGERIVHLAKAFGVSYNYIAAIKYGYTKFNDPSEKSLTPEYRLTKAEKIMFETMWAAYNTYKANNPYTDKEQLMEYLINVRKAL